ncbi:MAG: serine/threonine-protein phosphatase [Magnetococcales bacterium]|nr:serine/threonine-protein phosphatase [Magnetococcales bacterium]
MTARNAPLVDASMEVKYELAMFHLWLEELLEQDSSLDKKQVWHHLLEARWYLRAMLQGGENHEGRFYPLEKSELRTMLNESLLILDQLENVADTRLALGAAGQAGSDMDDKFDSAFKQALGRADQVETSIQEEIENQLNSFIQISALTSFITLGALLIAGWTMRRYEANRQQYIASLSASEQKYRTAFSTAEKAKKELDISNEKLLFERETIETIILKMRGDDVFDERHLRYLISSVEKTTGDILIATFTPEGRQLVLLGDFTGHGLPAAIGSPLVSYIFQELATKEFRGNDILQEIHNQLAARLPVGIFFAATLIEINALRDQAYFWNASMPECLIIRDKKVNKHFSSICPPLGIPLQFTIQDIEPHHLLKGDRIIAYSDGISEARNENEEFFGMNRLESFMCNIPANNKHLGDLKQHLDVFVGSSLHNDDITLVEIQI